MICNFCGFELSEDSKFCQRCGRKINSEMVYGQDNRTFQSANNAAQNHPSMSFSDQTVNTHPALKSCKKCGQLIPADSKKCPLCNSKQKKNKGSVGAKVAAIILAVIVVLLAGGNCYQFYLQTNTAAKLTDTENNLKDAQETINETKDGAALYKELTEAAYEKNIGYGSADFFANQGFIYISKSGGSKKIELTADYPNCKITKKHNRFISFCFIR